MGYDLAYFWRVDPEQMLARPLDLLWEVLEQSHRIRKNQPGE